MSITTIVLMLLAMTSAVVSKQPNIILLLTDDQDVLLGSEKFMPYYHKHLVEKGTTFKNYFVHTPICCSSRTSILTGRYIHNGGATGNGVAQNCGGPNWNNGNEKLTSAVYARQAGYRTSFAGKYVNSYGLAGGDAVPPGWEKWYGAVLNGFAAYYYNNSVIQSDDEGATSTRVNHGDNYATDYLEDLIANRTLDVIREFTNPSSSENPPFFIINAWTAPHGPFTPAPQYADLFPNITAPRTPNWNASSEYQQLKHWILRQQSPITAFYEKLIDATQQQRAQTLQSVDKHIDQIVTLLEERGVLNNTVIIYTSDNGFQLGQHRLVTDKLHLYESDIRVPFVVRGPGIPENKTVSDLTGSVDIFPTIYQLIHGFSAPIPDQVDGIPFLPVVLDTKDSKKRKLPKRTDYLINYHGTGTPPCNLLNLPPYLVNCPAPPANDFHALDTLNNTYNCLRTIVNGKQIDFTYCRFDDNENFTEYYDNLADPWQLQNLAYKLPAKRLAKLDERLYFLKTCKGITCRLGPYRYNSGNSRPQ